MMTVRRGIGLWLLLSSIGCVSFQDKEYLAAQKYRSHCAWWCCHDERCSSNPWSHYSCGWRQGYTDVLMGDDGECPPVPPQCYWSHKYQSPAGEMAVQRWFLGYSNGASAALASCRGDYHEIPISGMLQQCSPGCISSDYSRYPFGRTTLGLSYRPDDSEDDEDNVDGVNPPAIPASQLPAAPASIEPAGSTSEGPTAPLRVEPAGLPVAPDLPPTRKSSSGEDFIPPSPISKTDAPSKFFKKHFSGSWFKTVSKKSKFTGSVAQQLMPEAQPDLSQDLNSN